MAISVPQMQQRFTGYDFGQNTARNLLDAVRMKNQNEMQIRQMDLQKKLLDRRLTSAENMQDKQIKSTERIKEEDRTLEENLAELSASVQMENILSNENTADKNRALRSALGFGGLNLKRNQLNQDQNQFLMNFDEGTRRFGINQDNINREYDLKVDLLDEEAAQKRNKERVKELASTIAMEKAKEIEDSGRFDEELNRGINDTGFVQGLYDSLPFTRSTRQRVIDDNNIKPVYQAPSVLRQVQDNNVSGNFLDILSMTKGDFLNNPLFNTYQDDLNTIKLNP